jgi:hypothetical protein
MLAVRVAALALIGFMTAEKYLSFYLYTQDFRGLLRYMNEIPKAFVY